MTKTLNAYLSSLEQLLSNWFWTLISELPSGYFAKPLDQVDYADPEFWEGIFRLRIEDVKEEFSSSRKISESTLATLQGFKGTYLFPSTIYKDGLNDLNVFISSLENSDKYVKVISNMIESSKRESMRSDNQLLGPIHTNLVNKIENVQKVKKDNRSITSFGLRKTSKLILQYPARALFLFLHAQVVFANISNMSKVVDNTTVDNLIKLQGKISNSSAENSLVLSNLDQNIRRLSNVSQEKRHRLNMTSKKADDLIIRDRNFLFSLSDSLSAQISHLLKVLEKAETVDVKIYNDTLSSTKIEAVNHAASLNFLLSQLETEFKSKKVYCRNKIDEMEKEADNNIEEVRKENLDLNNKLNSFVRKLNILTTRVHLLQLANKDRKESLDKIESLKKKVTEMKVILNTRKDKFPDALKDLTPTDQSKFTNHLMHNLGSLSNELIALNRSIYELEEQCIEEANTNKKELSELTVEVNSHNGKSETFNYSFIDANERYSKTLFNLKQSLQALNEPIRTIIDERDDYDTYTIPVNAQMNRLRDFLKDLHDADNKIKDLGKKASTLVQQANQNNATNAYLKIGSIVNSLKDENSTVSLYKQHYAHVFEWSTKDSVRALAKDIGELDDQLGTASTELLLIRETIRVNEAKCLDTLNTLLSLESQLNHTDVLNEIEERFNYNLSIIVSRVENIRTTLKHIGEKLAAISSRLDSLNSRMDNNRGSIINKAIESQDKTKELSTSFQNLDNPMEKLAPESGRVKNTLHNLKEKLNVIMREDLSFLDQANRNLTKKMDRLSICNDTTHLPSYQILRELMNITRDHSIYNNQLSNNISQSDSRISSIINGGIHYTQHFVRDPIELQITNLTMSANLINDKINNISNPMSINIDNAGLTNQIISLIRSGRPEKAKDKLLNVELTQQSMERIVHSIVFTNKVHFDSMLSFINLSSKDQKSLEFHRLLCDKIDVPAGAVFSKPLILENAFKLLENINSKSSSWKSVELLDIDSVLTQAVSKILTILEKLTTVKGHDELSTFLTRTDQKLVKIFIAVLEKVITNEKIENYTFDIPKLLVISNILQSYHYSNSSLATKLAWSINLLANSNYFHNLSLEDKYAVGNTIKNFPPYARATFSPQEKFCIRNRFYANLLLSQGRGANLWYFKYEPSHNVFSIEPVDGGTALSSPRTSTPTQLKNSTNNFKDEHLSKTPIESNDTINLWRFRKAPGLNYIKITGPGGEELSVCNLNKVLSLCSDESPDVRKINNEWEIIGNCDKKNIKNIDSHSVLADSYASSTARNSNIRRKEKKINLPPDNSTNPSSRMEDVVTIEVNSTAIRR